MILAIIATSSIITRSMKIMSGMNTTIGAAPSLPLQPIFYNKYQKDLTRCRCQQTPKIFIISTLY